MTTEMIVEAVHWIVGAYIFIAPAYATILGMQSQDEIRRLRQRVCNLEEYARDLE